MKVFLENKACLGKYWKTTQSTKKYLSLLFSVGLSLVDEDQNKYKIALPFWGGSLSDKGFTIFVTALLPSRAVGSIYM